MIISEDFSSSRRPPVVQARDVRVYIARYDYNPYQGPNNCPELELELQAGALNIFIKKSY